MTMPTSLFKYNFKKPDYTALVIFMAELI